MPPTSWDELKICLEFKGNISNILIFHLFVDYIKRFYTWLSRTNKRHIFFCLKAWIKVVFCDKCWKLYSSDMPILTLSAHFWKMKLRYDNLQLQLLSMEYVKLAAGHGQLSNFHLHFLIFCTIFLSHVSLDCIALCSRSSFAIRAGEN